MQSFPQSLWPEGITQETVERLRAQLDSDTRQRLKESSERACDAFAEVAEGVLGFLAPRVSGDAGAMQLYMLFRGLREIVNNRDLIRAFYEEDLKAKDESGFRSSKGSR